MRKIAKILQGQPTIEGAGVHLKRVFGYHEVPLFDPFLLLDHFGSDNPEDYLAGFPWHPHRGIETVTYMLAGIVEHGDSLGNKGTIRSGDVQWMTAGNGIIHQEMPQKYDGLMTGFQLWVNLPASHKMMEPRYRDVTQTQIPEVELNQNTKIKVISGEVQGIQGPVQDIVVDTEYLDVTLSPGATYEHQVKTEYNAFVYVFEGRGYFEPDKTPEVEKEHLVLFEKGDRVKITATTETLRFLFVAGKPLNEPVAWRGPIVMNTQAELTHAFEEYRNGTFIKHNRK